MSNYSKCLVAVVPAKVTKFKTALCVNDYSKCNQ